MPPAILTLPIRTASEVKKQDRRLANLQIAQHHYRRVQTSNPSTETGRNETIMCRVDTRFCDDSVHCNCIVLSTFRKFSRSQNLYFFKFTSFFFFFYSPITVFLPVAMMIKSCQNPLPIWHHTQIILSCIHIS